MPAINYDYEVVKIEANTMGTYGKAIL